MLLAQKRLSHTIMVAVTVVTDTELCVCCNFGSGLICPLKCGLIVAVKCTLNYILRNYGRLDLNF